jgi:hypothetical protein
MSEIIKPTLAYTIVCDDVRQEAGGKISLMGLFENIFATNFPVLHPRLAVMSEWSDGRGDFSVTTKILTPDRKTILRETSSKISLRDTANKHRDISVHLNIELKAAGTYWIEHYLDNELISSLPLHVVHVKEQSYH